VRATTKVASPDQTVASGETTSTRNGLAIRYALSTDEKPRFGAENRP
jgi:hypothetical protein